MQLKTNQIALIALFCSALLGVTLWALYAEYNRPWKEYQRGSGGAGINQIWLRDLGITDRCTTCHQGADDIKFANEEQPFKTHSGDYLKQHPIERFGCVICHEGQGEALTAEAAHGEEKNWTRPILRGAQSHSSCVKCHLINNDMPLDISFPGAEKFIQGRRLFMEKNCIGCHKLSGYERPERIAPALTLIGSKVSGEWLRSWLKDPQDYLPDSKMPRFRLSDEEIGYVADYLMSNSPLPPLKLRGGAEGGGVNLRMGKGEGETLVNSLGCLGCHKINEKGTAFGPDLSDIGNKVKLDWLLQFLKNPKSYDPRTIIPDFKIPEKDIPAITEYLMSLKKEKHNIQNPPVSPLNKGELNSPLIRGVRGVFPSLEKSSEGKLSDNIEKGRTLVKELGCRGCHEIEKLTFENNAPELDGIGEKRVAELVFSNINGIEKNLINWLKIKVKEPGRFATDKIVTKMPDFNINDEETDALVTFLISIKDNDIPQKYKRVLVDHEAAESKGKRLLEKYNCTGCHKINNVGGVVGPDLTQEAKKARPEWLSGFLKAPVKIRPEGILMARMPDFNLSEKESNGIIEYLSSLSGVSYPYNFEPKQEAQAEEINDGEKLYHDIFGCVACHTLNGQGGKVGPDHTDIASTLKREWIEQWLKDPQKIKADVRMPKFKFEDWEFEALTDYLMTRGQYRFVEIKEKD
ncbi:MAG: c-type cytochrome [Nitrospirae bacterium]|nr:c-type cytochrome [Nitrospirota bacterium]